MIIYLVFLNKLFNKKIHKMENSNLKVDIIPLMSQLVKNEGATIALAKMLLNEDQFKKYLIEVEIQSTHTWREVYAKFKNLFDDEPDMDKYFERRIQDLKKERDDLKD